MINVFLDLDINLLESFTKAEQLDDLQGFITDLIAQEGVEVFIEKTLADALVDEEIIEYFNNTTTDLSELLRSAEIWSRKIIQDTSCNYYEWEFGTARPIKGEMLADIAERIFLYAEFCAIIAHSSYKNDQNYLYIIRDNPTLHPKQSNTIDIPLKRYLDKVSLDLWLSSCKTKRIFKHNPKHNRRAQRLTRNGTMTVDRLLCVEERAQELLLSALRDESETPRTPKLFSVDKAIDDIGNERIYVVEFMPSSDGTYHAYHLEDVENIGDLGKSKYTTYISNDLRNRIIDRWKQLE